MQTAKLCIRQMLVDSSHFGLSETLMVGGQYIVVLFCYAVSQSLFVELTFISNLLPTSLILGGLKSNATFKRIYSACICESKTGR